MGIHNSRFLFSCWLKYLNRYLLVNTFNTETMKFEKAYKEQFKKCRKNGTAILNKDKNCIWCKKNNKECKKQNCE